MKYVIIVADGAADEPHPSLDGRTPLMVARKPNLDLMASRGTVGTVKTVPKGFSPGSDVANLSLLGYDPALYYTGRSPLEAASMGVELGEEDIAFRCNLVTLSADEPYASKVMLDYGADEISSYEARELIQEINRQLGSESIKFYPGVSYRHLMVWHGGPDNLKLTPPHDISDQVIGPHLPEGERASQLLKLMEESYSILATHPINLNRERTGRKPGNSIWLWGAGRRPQLPQFVERFGLRGALISAVDLLRGIAVLTGLQVINVHGATGNINTNFRGKAEAALVALKEGYDFVLVHIEAPDEAGHRGEIATKIKAIEEIDAKVIAPILAGIEKLGPCKIMVLPDHPTPLALKTHTSDPVPFVIYQPGRPGKHPAKKFDEENCQQSKLKITVGHQLMDFFLSL